MEEMRKNYYAFAIFKQNNCQETLASAGVFVFVLGHQSGNPRPFNDRDESDILPGYVF